MRLIFLLFLCVALLPTSLFADVYKYIATGNVVYVENNGTDADGIVSVGEDIVTRFTIDTTAPIGWDEDNLPDFEASHYFASYPIYLEFSGGLSVTAVPPSSGPWYVGEQVRILFYDSGTQVSAAHYTGHNSEGTNFIFNTPITVDWIDLGTSFNEFGPPFELTSLGLLALPPLSAFDQAGLSLSFNDYSTNENTFFVAEFSDLTLVPNVSCDGFLPPLHEYPVRVKKNRVLPHKMSLIADDSSLLTDADLTSPPVLEVSYQSGIEADPVDVTDDALPAGNSSEGNQFVFNDEGYWQFNLSTKNYSAPGIYTINVKSGDEWEYQINPTCETKFSID